MAAGFKNKKVKEIDPQYKPQFEAQVKALAKLEKQLDTLSNSTTFEDRYFLHPTLDLKCIELRKELVNNADHFMTKEQIDAWIREEKTKIL
jgi:hypothetical protein